MPLPAFDAPINYSDTALTKPPRRISFRHPAYSDNVLPLLTLPGLDGSAEDGSDGGGGGGGGIDYDIALVACGVLAGNRWEGACFSRKCGDESGASLEVIARPQDGILRHPECFFHPGGVSDAARWPACEKFPVIPSFRHWVFPHNNLPPPWSSLGFRGYAAISMSTWRDAVLQRDTTCRITGSALSLEQARLVPKDELTWFEQNGMSRYSETTSGWGSINDLCNALTLRSDVHTVFDGKRFALVPAQRDSGNHDSGSALRIYVLDGRRSYDSTELRKLYHDRLLQDLKGLSAEYVFARFAWAILGDPWCTFLGTPGEMFALRLRDKTVVDVPTNDVEIVAAAALPEPIPQSRCVSPNKCQRSEHSQAGDIEVDTMVTATSYWREEQERGRKRHRTS